MRHACCKGVRECQAAISEQNEDSKIRTVGDKALVECHHPQIICQYQYQWYGFTRFCNCQTHELLQKLKEGQDV